MNENAKEGKRTIMSAIGSLNDKCIDINNLSNLSLELLDKLNQHDRIEEDSLDKELGKPVFLIFFYLLYNIVDELDKQINTIHSNITESIEKIE